MARAINRLTVVACNAAGPGRHADGNGLWLEVSPSKARRWLFIYRFDGRRPEMGLGGYPAISLAVAREAAGRARATLTAGINPIVEKRTTTAPNFGVFAESLVDDREKGWKNAKHRQQWRNTLRTYAVAIWNTPLSEVDTEGVVKCLRDIWMTKPETGSRVRGRIEAVLNAAKAKGYRSGENPAVWRGHLDQLLPRRRKLSRGHHAAMPYGEVPAFMTSLREQRGVAARALEFLILTAARTSEVLEAQREEFAVLPSGDLWTVPAVRMKANRQHRVPLSPHAQKILQSMATLEGGYVFPGQKRDKPLSNMALEMVLRRMQLEITVHGFRSSFRDWAGDMTDVPREVIEAALAHLVGDKAEQAYRRGDALNKRRDLMDQWAQFCLQEKMEVKRPAEGESRLQPSDATQGLK